MQGFMRKFIQLNEAEAKVILRHGLFDSQKFHCDALCIIDDDRVGLIIKNHEIFMYKQDVKVAEIDGNSYIISDGRLTIVVKKL